MGLEMARRYTCNVLARNLIMIRMYLRIRFRLLNVVLYRLILNDLSEDV